ncbi:MAG: hypothetical protein COZ18_10515 [Flexibacter sp. CG_4_10_14_3_um_filter_32_15]|nr:MAG: hypothetical protein COZ18_10515 [Flexibacter sp. CG_4_10_14_3_um_filter_32_15]
MFRKHKVKLKQIVFYIGKGKANMITEVSHEDLNFRFSVISIQEIAYTEFLNSDKPEEIILAILADFKNENPSKVIQSILQKIIDTTNPNLDQLKYVRQLEVLSLLRDLQKETLKQSKNMALIYDIKKDLRYQEGRQEGKIEQTILAIKAFVEMNVPYQKIADSLKVSVEFVEEIAKSIKK